MFSELLHLEEAIEQWSGIEPRSWEDFLKGLKEIREQYARFFKSRFYYVCILYPLKPST